MVKKTLVLGVVFVLALFLGFANYSWAEEGLVAYWEFDEGRGDIAKDGSGNYNHGKIHGATWVEGKIGGALRFDGVDDYIEVGNDNSLNFGAGVDFTIKVWIKTPADGAIKNVFAGRTAGGYDIGWWMSVRGDRGNRLAFEISDGSALRIQLLSRNEAIPHNEWVHIALTADRDGVATVYINGVYNNSVDISAQPGNLSNRFNKRIGSAIAGLAPFNGLIDNVVIYNRVLTGKEIQNHYISSEKGVF